MIGDISSTKNLESSKSPFLKYFGTRVDRIDIEQIHGSYDDQKNIWVGGAASGMVPKTREKSAKILNEDESADW